MIGEKYRLLAQQLLATSGSRLAMSFREIEELLGVALPPSASMYQEWWHGRTPHRSQETAWLSVGWHVEHVDLASRRVLFVRN